MGIQIEADGPVSEGVDGLNETGGTLDDLEAELWAEVFKNCCAEAASFEAAESWADNAVVAYRRRVGTARGA